MQDRFLSLCQPDLPGYPKNARWPIRKCFGFTQTKKDLFERTISLHIKCFRPELDEQFTISGINVID